MSPQMHSTLIHFNPVNKRRQPISKYHIIPKIALPSTLGFPAWSNFIPLSDKTLLRLPHLPQARYLLRPAHLPCHDLVGKIS